MFSKGIASFCFWLLFSLLIAVFVFVSGFWYYWSNIAELLSISPSANKFIIGDFIVHYKDCLTYSGRTDSPGELCFIFSIQKNLKHSIQTLLRCLIFLLGSLTVTLTHLLFEICFFFRSWYLFHSGLEDFPPNSKGDASFYHTV